MAGILSGLSGLGLKNLENMNIYEEEKKEEAAQPAAPKAPPKVEEKELLYNKTFTCVCCDKKFTSKIMKSGKAKLLRTDEDLRAKYDGIDPIKYDVVLCPECGYAALTRFFANLTAGQSKLIQENISQSVQMHPSGGDSYTYEEALERYQLALACAVVKRARASEKAYICLKSAWLLRGWKESLEEDGNADAGKLEELKKGEEEYLQNAYNGFVEACQSENFPMCGMDENTVNYLLAVLAKHLQKYDVASKMVATLLTSASASPRIKDKARDLKDQILAELKKNKQG